MYQTIFQTVSDALFLAPISASGDLEAFVEVNQAATQLLGYSADELRGMKPHALVCPSDRSRIPERLEDLRKAERHVFSTVFLSKEGRSIPVEIHVRLLDRPDGLYALTTVRAVAEERFAEPALRTRQDRFRTFIENTSDWVWESDREGVITYSNPRASQILGFVPEELVGKSFLSLLADEHRDSARQLLEANKRKPRSGLITEREYRGKAGRSVFVETTAEPIISENGEFLGLRCISRDVTDRKLFQARMHEQSEQMKNAIEQQTRELRERNQDLTSALEEKKRFIQQAEEYNLALKTVLEKMKENETEISGRVFERISKDVIPLLRRARKGKKFSQALLDLAEKHLREIPNRHGSPCAWIRHRLTVAEIRITSLIRENMSSKEIAEELGLSVHTINNHARNIRKKLGIKRSTNLRSYLSELEL